MTLHQFHLIAFAAGSVIHGAQGVLVWRYWRETTAERIAAKEAAAICVVAFFWQFGNLWRELALTYQHVEGSPIFEIGNAMGFLALLSFPILFSYTIANIQHKAGISGLLIRLGTWLRYPLMMFAAIAAASLGAFYLGRRPLIDPSMASALTLNVMLLYFMLFVVIAVIGRRLSTSTDPHTTRYNRASTLAALLPFIAFVAMLFLLGRFGRFGGWIELFAMMTSVPYAIAAGYRLYQFPFMDAFLRDVLTGAILLVAFCVAFSFGFKSSDMLPVWLATILLVLAFSKAPVAHWVDRTFLGYSESLEAQEERIGNAVRGLTQFSDFQSRVCEIIKVDFQADWVEIGAEAHPDAVSSFQIPGATSLWLSLGPRRGARSYMSRQLRVARYAVLELAAQHHLLQQHELRETTARAQMRALQAQINPHFLFNTLNVLANLIHSNPAKAEHITEDLAGIFRYALESTRLEWVKLDDELHFLESYLEIERARFEERLTYSFDIDPSIRAMRIPPMILQPLIENAIRHGISPKVEGGHVRMTAAIDHERVIITVEDSGEGLRNVSRGGAGIGLTNVRERLAHVYGEVAALRLEDLRPAGTRVVLTLPQPLEVHV